MILEALIATAIIIGASFVLVGSIGLIRLSDLYSRLHGPTKATTLGLGAMLLGSVLYFTGVNGDLSLHEVLVTIFLFLTAPASAHMVARAGLHDRVRTVTRPPRDGEAFPEIVRADAPIGPTAEPGAQGAAPSANATGARDAGAAHRDPDEPDEPGR